MTAALDGASIVAMDVDLDLPHRRRRDILLVICLVWLALITFAAVFSSWLPIADTSKSVGDIKIAPFTHWPEFLGTDGLGRSQLARTLAGARVSLLVGFAASGLGVVIAGTIGILAGMSRKRLDAVIGLSTDTMLAFPALVLLLGITAVLGPGVKTVIIGLSVVSLPGLTRISRANTLRYVDAEFVLAARALGASRTRIIVREIVPNVLPPLLAYVPVIMAGLIVAEAGLSFLGLGIIPPTPSWGSSIAIAQRDFAQYPYLVIPPALALSLTVFAIGAVGERLRIKLDRT